MVVDRTGLHELPRHAEAAALEVVRDDARVARRVVQPDAVPLRFAFGVAHLRRRTRMPPRLHTFMIDMVLETRGKENSFTTLLRTRPSRTNARWFRGRSGVRG